MATKTINKKEYQITQVTGTRTGSISIMTLQDFRLKTYRRRFGRLGDWFARKSFSIKPKQKCGSITGYDNRLTLKSRKVTIEGNVTFKN